MRLLRSMWLICLGVAAGFCPRGRAQAAFLLEDADGISKVLIPTGHDAMYFARICADSPIRLRRCTPGEAGVVISRYKGIAGYDWLAIPLVPYLYSVEDTGAVSARVDRETVESLRQQYHEARLMSLGKEVPEGGRIKRGWNQLVGAAFERRIYAFRFRTTAEQDDELIARMNAGANRSHFQILFHNCADFARGALNFYFPGKFNRRLLPDGGITTPRQVAWELVRYAQRHPEVQLTVFEVPLVPGYRLPGRVGEDAAGSLTLTGYVVAIAFLNPWAGGAIVADYLVWGRYPLPLRHAEAIGPENMAPLRFGAEVWESSDSTGDGRRATAVP